MDSNLIELGYVSGAFGIKGMVKLKVYCHPQDSILFSQKECYLSLLNQRNSETKKLTIQQIKLHGDEIICQFEGINDRDAAQALRGYTVQVARDDFPETDDETFYWVDLIGCDVFYANEEQDERLFAGPESQEFEEIDPIAEALTYMGKVRTVSENGVHAILHVCPEVELADGQKDFKRTPKGQYVDQLIPFVRQRVPYVDLQTAVIITDIPPEN
ncbi:ribosome maturation factor RimM [Basilea psittacipulmonis]|uniref:Ribosome maturation factor RimM n=1 Tax=Basilea psittacipulmonis DSM 24701 TaxID=1072685 RepID=A0A077DEX9_9BURK|nr:ribosome maturation factor RimM [Basilea psittacipulmonis]AIL32696.1 hypothetical protein IX83_04675 [Basilea psittacipulmonis DSM 24701]